MCQRVRCSPDTNGLSVNLGWRERSDLFALEEQNGERARLDLLGHIGKCLFELLDTALDRAGGDVGNSEIYDLQDIVPELSLFPGNKLVAVT